MVSFRLPLDTVGGKGSACRARLCRDTCSLASMIRACEVVAMKQPRPRKLPGATYELQTGCGCVYVTCNEKDGRLFEVFAKLGKSGGCGSATMEGLGKAISIGLRTGVDPLDLCKSLSGIQCHKSPSCVDAVAVAIREHVG